MLFVLAFLTTSVRAQSFSTLLSFTDYAEPYGDLTLSGTTLYGLEANGVFSLPVTGGTETLLSQIPQYSGYQFRGSLVLSGSTLYGMTSQGPGPWFGSVFGMPVTGGSLTTLHIFNGYSGGYPNGSLILSGSTLYGMTSAGGTIMRARSSASIPTAAAIRTCTTSP